MAKLVGGTPLITEGDCSHCDCYWWTPKTEPLLSLPWFLHRQAYKSILVPPSNIKVSSTGQFTMILRKSPRNLLRAQVACSFFVLVGSAMGPFTLCSRVSDAQVLSTRFFSLTCFMMVDNLACVKFHLTQTCCGGISSRSFSSQAFSIILWVELIGLEDVALSWAVICRLGALEYFVECYIWAIDYPLWVSHSDKWGGFRGN